MKRTTRRQFLTNIGVGVGSAVILDTTTPLRVAGESAAAANESKPAPAEPMTAIDFRYSPYSWQTAFCFPDDPHKSLVGDHGELRCDHPGQYHDIHDFREIVGFSLEGMEADKVAGQYLEAPGIPIVHTRIDRPEAYLELTTFATRDEGEGRVDNVILSVQPRSEHSLHATPLIDLRTSRAVRVKQAGEMSSIHFDGENGPLFLAVDSRLTPVWVSPFRHQYALKTGKSKEGQFFRYFLRLPKEGQTLERIQGGFANADGPLARARTFWQNWRPFENGVDWTPPGRYGEFLVACARNIQQAREVKEGKATFQVGPTVYRGLWVADGNFILEAARYLGYDQEAQQGLETIWNRQLPNGGVFAGGGDEHWKETGIALFTLVRQAELANDWTYFRKMEPNILRAVGFIRDLREKARHEDSANGRYGLLPRGFADGGLGGVRSEFTNTIWTLAGLKAATEAAEHLGLTSLSPARQLYTELRQAFFAAAKQEMRRHPKGFEYLPMLMKEDPQWEAPDPWDRPRPQQAQWALSQAIFPGRVFDRDDPIVKGHIELMQACTVEEIPAETGWLPHEGVWNYGAAFVAHVYLWAALRDRARMTFGGFLNHATPLYCWREEQPLQRSLVASYIGDMPHNWASAECILYLRHMLALEDGATLRLLAGFGDGELVGGDAWQLAQSPTRFGRVNLSLEPLDGHRGWHLRFERRRGRQPQRVELPTMLGSRYRLTGVKGASSRAEGSITLVSPDATTWEATWEA